MYTVQYGGEVIEVKNLTGNKLLTYKQRNILLSDIDDFITRLDSPFLSPRLIAGTDPKQRVILSKDHNGDIAIGCLTDTESNFYQLYHSLKHSK